MAELVRKVACWMLRGLRRGASCRDSNDESGVWVAQPQGSAPAIPPLRAWQRSALSAYLEVQPRKDFLVTATPGSGKTTFALTLAKGLLHKRTIDRVIVVCPTDHLRTQWADAADRLGIALDAALTNAVGPVRADLVGYVTTYAQVAAKPALHRARATNKRSLVILDFTATAPFYVSFVCQAGSGPGASAARPGDRCRVFGDVKLPGFRRSGAGDGCVSFGYSRRKKIDRISAKFRSKGVQLRTQPAVVALQGFIGGEKVGDDFFHPADSGFGIGQDRIVCRVAVRVVVGRDA
jgi:hypothetical protein